MTSTLFKSSFYVGILLLSITMNAFASCESEKKTLFSCTTKAGKRIELCDAGKAISYSFGKSASKPEIAISVARNTALISEYQGFGRYMTTAVAIPNGNTEYQVFFSVDKLEDHKIESGVHVSINDKHVATIHCDPARNLINNMEAAGLESATNDK